MQLNNHVDIKIVALRNDIAALRNEFTVQDHPEYCKLLDIAYSALDDLVYTKIL